MTDLQSLEHEFWLIVMIIVGLIMVGYTVGIIADSMFIVRLLIHKYRRKS